MKLTPQERIEAYKWAATEINEGGKWICIMLQNKFGLSEKELFKTFPEFELFKPIRIPFGYGRTAWFANRLDYNSKTKEARLFILGSCILMAEEAEE